MDITKLSNKALTELHKMSDLPPLNWSTLICLESRRIGYGEEELQA